MSMLKEFMNNLMFKIPLKAAVILILLALTACGGFKKVDQRQMPDGSKAKARKNKGAEAANAVFSVLSQK